MALKGFTRVSGSSRWRETASGKEISKRAYDDLRAKDVGFRNYRDYQNQRKDTEYAFWVKRYAQSEGIPEKRVRRLDSRFNERYVDTFRSPTGRPKKRLSNESGKPKDRWLRFLGLRRTEMKWPVGETDRILQHYRTLDDAISAGEDGTLFDDEEE
jgi:hypothetical protein